MQRFKDFTKKSGKVASAILSAAMVTSMVAGTNVVYAATDTAAEATTDVQATVNSDYEAVRAAKADLEAKLAGLPVTVALTDAEVTPDNDSTANSITCLDDFEAPIEEVETQYGVTVTFAELDKATEAPTLTKDGKVTLTYKIAKNATPEVTAKIVYTVGSYEKRQAAATAAIKKALSDYAVNNTTATDNIDDVVEGVLTRVAGVELVEFADFDAATIKTTFTNKVIAGANTTGTIEAEITAEQKAGADICPVDTIYTATIPTNTERMNKAVADAKDFLTNDARYLDADIVDATTFEPGLKAYLANFYPDITVDTATVDTTDGKTAYTVDDPADQNADGKATVTFGLITDGTKFTLTDAASTSAALLKDKETVAVTTKDFALTLASDETKTKRAIADLMAAAEKVEVTSADTVATYNDKLEVQLGTDLGVYQSATEAFAIDDGTYAFTNGLAKVYANMTGSAQYVEKDASAGKDGDPKVIFTVNSGKETETATYVYTIDSAQTTVDKAAAAVQAVLDAMNITNDTKDTDVMAAVEEAIKPYEGVVASLVTFDKANATADKEGTAKIVVELKDEKNGLPKTAGADKTFAFKSNTFVEENGKKYYYGKDGKLATTDKGYFLQGTDSPDGYTYFIQNDGSVMQDRLTYHPDGEHVIYFDKDGHEVFDAFVNVKKDAQGQDVDYIGYFDTFGYAYVNQTTYGNGEGAYSTDALFYINDYGVLENKGWFQNAAGEIGYAATNGTLTTSQWSLDQFGRKVYFQANGFLAKGLMTDGVKYYQLDENDGHLVGEF